MRAVERAVGGGSPLLAELDYGDHLFGLGDDEVVVAARLAAKRGGPAAALLGLLLTRIGPSDVPREAVELLAEHVAGPGPTPPWFDLVGEVRLRRAHRLVREHGDLDIVWLEFGYPDDRWPHVVGFAIDQVIGGFDQIDIDVFEDWDELDTEMELEREQLKEHGFQEAEFDDSYLRGRLPLAYRLGLEASGWGDGAESAWTVGAHRLQVFTGVDPFALPWPPEVDHEAVEVAAREAGRRLSVPGLDVADVTECLRWIFEVLINLGLGGSAVLAPESIRLMMTSVWVTDAFTGTSLAPRAPDVLRALVDDRSAREAWSQERRDEVVAMIDGLDPAYQLQCAEDFAHPSAVRVTNNPDVDFRDAAAVRLWNHSDWADPLD